MDRADERRVGVPAVFHRVGPGNEAILHRHMRVRPRRLFQNRRVKYWDTRFRKAVQFYVGAETLGLEPPRDGQKVVRTVTYERFP